MPQRDGPSQLVSKNSPKVRGDDSVRPCTSRTPPMPGRRRCPSSKSSAQYSTSASKLPSAAALSSYIVAPSELFRPAQQAPGKIDGDADGLQSRPHLDGNSGADATARPERREQRNNGTEVGWRNSNVAVADGEFGRLRGRTAQLIHLVLAPFGAQSINRDGPVRIIVGEPPNDRPGVTGVGDGKLGISRRVILVTETREMLGNDGRDRTGRDADRRREIKGH